MSTWKVSIEEIKLFDHFGADRLQIGKLGTNQVVVPKGKYKDGDKIIFIPSKSLIPKDIYEGEEFAPYLTGPENNRVKPINLRGEYSDGVILPLEKVQDRIKDFGIGDDISMVLGIQKYIPFIPACLEGKVDIIKEEIYSKHECEHFGIYAKDFVEGERVVITEKVHGSQINYYYNFDTGYEFVSQKGLISKGLCLVEDYEVGYWKAVKNSNLRDLVKSSFDKGIIQIFGELIPIQKGYHYGQEKETLVIYDVRVCLKNEGDEWATFKSIPYDMVPDALKTLWVPVLFDGPLNFVEVRKLSKGNELISGRSCHIREGVVIAPYIVRRAYDRTRLTLKILNPDYRETGEEVN
jgi:RNA ligase (TIGR02306 family)